MNFLTLFASGYEKLPSSQPGCDPYKAYQANLAAHLSMADVPEVDVLIRNGGEHLLVTF